MHAVLLTRDAVTGRLTWQVVAHAAEAWAIHRVSRNAVFPFAWSIAA